MDYLSSVVEILAYESPNSKQEIRAVLEDTESPIRRKTVEELYQYTIEKKHVDFGDIPKSGGDISKYKGYTSMMDTLGAVRTLIKEDQAYAPLNSAVGIVGTALTNILENKQYYTAAFSKKIEVLILEYNAFVYACVEAVTAVLYQFADYMKTPSQQTLSGAFQNNKYRADEFFIEQLTTFNKLNATGNYQKYLAETVRGGTENFAMTPFMVGSIAIAGTVMLSIVPVTRRIIYAVQDMRGRLAQTLELQAYFLELHKAELEKHPVHGSVDKSRAVMKKQEAVRLKFLRLADKLRVKSVEAEKLAKKTIEEEDRKISLAKIKDDIADSEVSIF